MSSITVSERSLESWLRDATNILRGPVDASDFKAYTAVNFGTAAVMTIAGSAGGAVRSQIGVLPEPSIWLERGFNALFVLPTQGACSSVQACARP